MTRPPTKQQARLAQRAILGVLDRPSWARGVGITCAGPWLGAEGWGGVEPGDPLPCTHAVAVNVRDDEDVELARSLVGDNVYGVPVVFQAVGDIVAQTGYAGADDEATERARYAKGIVRDLLNRPSWGRGVGLTCAALGETWAHAGPDAPCRPAVGVMVQRPEHVALARNILGSAVYGVPVVIEAVGDFYPAQNDVGRAPPTSPPPFGNPEGHIGGSYDWYWWNFGRHAGVPYEPTDEAEVETRHVDRAVTEMARRLGIVDGDPESHPVWLAGLATWRGPDGRMGVKVNMNVEPFNWIMMDVEDALDAPHPAEPTVLGVPVWIQNVGGPVVAQGLVA
jgi:hypothetical protein